MSSEQKNSLPKIYLRNEFSFHIGVSKVKEEVEVEVYCRHWKW